MAAESTKTVLITGGSGFLALHCVAQALAAGYKVKTTVRSKAKQADVLKGVGNAQPPVDVSNLSFATVDLLKDDGWEEALRGCQLVLHVASPLPGVPPKDENLLIKPAVDGTLRVLKAAKAAGTVTRVVVTSSCATINMGTPYRAGKTYSELDWSDPDGKGAPVTAYMRSKILAEKAAWDFIQKEGGEMQLAVVNPGMIFGPPLLIPHGSTTVGVIEQMLQGKIPALPNASAPIVDVRDVAALHLLAAAAPGAAGQRFIAAVETLSYPEIGLALKSAFGPKASKVPTRTLPDFVVRLMSHTVMSQLKAITPDLSRPCDFTNAKAKNLGWSPRSAEDAVISCGQALIDAKVC